MELRWVKSICCVSGMVTLLALLMTGCGSNDRGLSEEGAGSVLSRQPQPPLPRRIACDVAGDILVYDQDGGFVARVTTSGGNSDPTWAFGNDWIAFIKQVGSDAQLWKIPMDPATGQPTGPETLILGPSTDLGGPSWGRQSGWIIYHRYNPATNHNELYATNPAQTPPSEVLIVSDPNKDYMYPDWTFSDIQFPRIVYQKGTGGVWNVYRRHIVWQNGQPTDGSNERELCNNPHLGAFRPSYGFGPADNAVVFARKTFIGPPPGSEIYQICRWDGDDGGGTWKSLLGGPNQRTAPDAAPWQALTTAKDIVWSDQNPPPPGTFKLWTAGWDGQNATPIPPPNGTDGNNPAWNNQVPWPPY